MIPRVLVTLMRRAVNASILSISLPLFPDTVERVAAPPSIGGSTRSIRERHSHAAGLPLDGDGLSNALPAGIRDWREPAINFHRLS
jgi:hypothetical protein